jgi:cytochrome c biogenesis protein CcmG/thiol:disulfide interchange protein DsbE
MRFLPLGIFLAVALALGFGLSLSPTLIPSALVGKPAPEFSMVIEGDETRVFTTSQLADGKRKLINIFASWCQPCEIEHPMLMALKDSGISIYGIAQKDSVKDSKNFLKRLGNPYVFWASDVEGRVSIDFGASGVPETYLIDGSGKILFQHIGPLTNAVIQNKIKPLLAGEN